MISSGSRLTKPLMLVPFLYSLITRFNGARDRAYLVASSWIPATWLIFRLSDVGLVAAIVKFALGYLAFIAVYEIGYFINDAWDARKSAAGRRRIDFAWGPAFVILFVAIRVALWLAIGYATGWISDPVWLACFAALAAAIAQHNLIASPALRAASFFQLSTLRFAVPVVASVPRQALLLVFAAALLFYTYFRFLSYLDSKALLDMPARRRPQFGFVQGLMLAPLAILISFLSSSTILAELALYFVMIFGLWIVLSPKQNASDL